MNAPEQEEHPDSPSRGYGRHSNESLRENLTKEMLAELEETFESAAEANGVLQLSRLPLALKALGMSMSESDPALHTKEIDLERFLEIVQTCMKHPTWAANEMSESYALFDRHAAGNIGPGDLRTVFSRLGENLLETELRDQLREFDIDGDLLMAVAEYYKMISATRGLDFAFEDAHF